MIYLCIYNPLPNHFSKAGSSWEGGIANVYHDPCQDWMDLINMKLTSPNYPEPYDVLEYCKWTITAPPGHLVTLSFEIINVSRNRRNMFSRIKLSMERHGRMTTNLTIFDI